jgi:hypothetical protein
MLTWVLYRIVGIDQYGIRAIVLELHNFILGTLVGHFLAHLIFMIIWMRFFRKKSHLMELFSLTPGHIHDFLPQLILLLTIHEYIIGLQ